MRHVRYALQGLVRERAHPHAPAWCLCAARAMRVEQGQELGRWGGGEEDRYEGSSG